MVRADAELGYERLYSSFVFYSNDSGMVRADAELNYTRPATVAEVKNTTIVAMQTKGVNNDTVSVTTPGNILQYKYKYYIHIYKGYAFL